MRDASCPCTVMLRACRYCALSYHHAGCACAVMPQKQTSAHCCNCCHCCHCCCCRCCHCYELAVIEHPNVCATAYTCVNRNRNLAECEPSKRTWCNRNQRDPDRHVSHITCRTPCVVIPAVKPFNTLIGVLLRCNIVVYSYVFLFPNQSSLCRGPSGCW